MYIHGYQIHNVLNVYRKQLSQPNDAGKAKVPHSDAPAERISISADGQRQSIFDKISTEIVNRITQFDASTRLDTVMSEKLALQPAHQKDDGNSEEIEFSYNVIDEHNRKIANTLPLQRLSPMERPSFSIGETEVSDNHQTKTE